MPGMRWRCPAGDGVNLVRHLLKVVWSRRSGLRRAMVCIAGKCRRDDWSIHRWRLIRAGPHAVSRRKQENCNQSLPRRRLRRPKEWAALTRVMQISHLGRMPWLRKGSQWAEDLRKSAQVEVSGQAIS